VQAASPEVNVPKQLVVTGGPDKGRVFPIVGEDILLIGRSKTTPTRLNDPHVSRVHCQVQLKGGRLVLTDAGSVAGTLVNGVRVSEHELRAGDVITIGETQIRYQDEGAEATTLAPPSARAPGKLPSPTDLEGKTISHYQVGPLLARGASGTIFRARDTKNNMEVALKVLQADMAQNEDEMQRFVRAMKTMMPHRHPNLVAIYGAGKTGAYCWVAMEYVDGESAAAMIQRIGVAGMLDWRQTLRLAVHIARALAYAEQQHILHRNITPRNILVSNRDKVAKLGDLMLAKALEGTLAQQITRPGELLGDVNYMSPERTQGTLAVDGRSDVYSLGATIYALLTGRPPFVGESLPEIILKIRQEEPAKPRKMHLAVPDVFEGIVLKMLAKRPEDRVQTAGELVSQLERVATFQNVAV
jgi:serine/threonine protein kinase